MKQLNPLGDMNNNNGYFRLAATAIAHCFVPISKAKDVDPMAVKERRRNFGKHSLMIALFADCSYNFTEEKLRENIVNHNT